MTTLSSSNLTFTPNNFDFSKNCSLTSDFYNAWTSQVAKLLPYIQPLLVPDLSSQPEIILQQKLQDSNLGLQVIPQAITHCRDTICRNLKFTGNADIAGIGAVVAYGSICGTVSLLVPTQFGQYWIEEGPERLGKPLGQIILSFYEVSQEISRSFYGTLCYFALMAQIAFQVYLPRMSTMYEFTIAQLVCRFTVSAANMMLFRLQRDSDLDVESMTVPIHMVAMLWSIITGFELISGHWQNRTVSYSDYPCDGLYSISLALLRISAIEHVVAIISFWFLLILGLMSVSWQNKISNAISVLPILVIGWEFLAMWIHFGFIVMIRGRARALFGNTYADNFVGYGQILAAGFCVEAVVKLITGWASSVIQAFRESKSNRQLARSASNEDNNTRTTTNERSQSRQSQQKLTPLHQPSIITDHSSSLKTALHSPTKTSTILVEEGQSPVPVSAMGSASHSYSTGDSATKSVPLGKNMDNAAVESSIASVDRRILEDKHTGHVSRRSTFQTKNAH